MAEPFKNRLNPELVTEMAHHFGRVWPEFDKVGFVASATNGLEQLELKQRASLITDALEGHLPEAFSEAVDVLVRSLAPDTGETTGVVDSGPTAEGIRGWPVMSMTDYVARRGLGHVPTSLAALKDMTSRFSSEFAIRPFLDRHEAETLATLTIWLDDPSEHVRRLVSEGTRPRLPWGMRLNRFVADPSPVIALLERLKDDPSEFVRRSVANNLNDIAKDHPELVVDVARRWLPDAPEPRQRLVRHALRTLVKAGHEGALEVLGFGRAEVSLLSLDLSAKRVAVGETLAFEVELRSEAAVPQSLIIDYAVHHMRANGTLSPKVFKWKTASLEGGASLVAAKRHSFRPVTTRRYYPGRHRIEVLVNGEVLGGADFELADSAAR